MDGGLPLPTHSRISHALGQPLSPIAQTQHAYCSGETHGSESVLLGHAGTERYKLIESIDGLTSCPGHTSQQNDAE